jgi:hypothetical protein
VTIWEIVALVYAGWVLGWITFAAIAHRKHQQPRDDNDYTGWGG